MGLVGLLVAGGAVGGLARVLWHDRPWWSLPLLGAMTSMLAGVIGVAAGAGEIHRFYSRDAWLVGAVAAGLALAVDWQLTSAPSSRAGSARR
jgi:hypothetical protein